MRRKVLALAVCALALAGAARADDAPPGANPIQALDDCVSVNARRLEISGEAADVVADAALAKCARELSTAARGGPSREELRTSMRGAALLDVVELRATRHAPAASPPPKPARNKRKHSG